MWRGETDGGTKDSSYYVWYVRGGINEPTPNSPPTLSYSFDLGYGTDGVDPESGTTATTFTYKVIYTDADDEAPTSLNVHIDGGSNAMTVDSGCGTLCDGDYTNGEQYVYSITLSSGSHDYYLDTSDGTDTDRLPASGTLSGPTVYALLNIVTSTLPDGTETSAYSQTLSATGGDGSYTWSISAGSLSAGLSINSSTGEISGTPTTAGTSNFTVQVTDGLSNTDTQALAITINAAVTLSITTTSLPNGTVGLFYSQNPISHRRGYALHMVYSCREFTCRSEFK